MRNIEVSKTWVQDSNNYEGTFFTTIAGIPVHGIYEVQDSGFSINRLEVGAWEAEEQFNPKVFEYIADLLLEEV